MGISVGVVGLGRFGTHFVGLFKKHPRVKRIALCDLHPERLAECAREFEIEETYPSLEEICKSDIEALAIFSQPWLHTRQCIQAMEAGKHISCAVPAAYSLDECDDLVRAVEKTGMLYMNFETSFFRPECAFCRKKAAEGAFGQFIYAQAEYFHDFSLGLEDIARHRWGEEWSRDKSGSPPMYYPTHSVSFIVSVMGAHMTEVSAQGFIYPGDDWFRKDTMWKNPFSDEVALFRMSNGATARICEFRRVGYPTVERVSAVYGTEGSFEHSLSGAVWVDIEGKEEVKPPMHHEELPEPLASNLGGHGGSHAYLVHEFVDAVDKKRLPRINVWEAVRYCAPGLVAHKSALKGGELLKVPDWGDAPR